MKKITSIVVIGAFLFNTAFIDMGWARHGSLLSRVRTVEAKTSVAQVQEALPVPEGTFETAVAIPVLTEDVRTSPGYEPISIKNPPPEVTNPISSYSWTEAGYKGFVQQQREIHGSWPNAVRAAGYKPIQRESWPDERIMSLLKNPPPEVSDPLNCTSWRNAGGYNGMLDAASKRWGWHNALRKAGRKPMQKPASGKQIGKKRKPQESWQGRYTDWDAVREIIPYAVKPGGGIIKQPVYPDRDKDEQYLNQDEVAKLSAEVKKANLAAKEALMELHEGLLIKVAKHVRGLNADLDIKFDDLLHVGRHGVGSGVGGLERAVELFDPKRKVKFSDYAWRAIERPMRRYVKRLRRQRTISIDEEAGDEETSLSQSLADDGKMEPQERARVVIKSEKIIEILRSLDESARNKEIFIRHIMRGETLEEIGKSHGITRERVRQIVSHIKRKIRRELKAKDDTELSSTSPIREGMNIKTTVPLLDDAVRRAHSEFKEYQRSLKNLTAA